MPNDPGTARIIVIPEIVHLDADELTELHQGVTQRHDTLQAFKREIDGGKRRYANTDDRDAALATLNLRLLRCERLTRLLAEQLRITQTAERAGLS